MKRTAAILALLLVLTMLLGIGATAYAAPTNVSLTVPDDGHTYEIYQIFTGDYNADALSNVLYGQNAALPAGKAVGDPVDSGVLTAVEAISGSDSVKASALSAYVDFTSAPYATVSDGAGVSVPTGYYVVKDKDSVALGAGDEHTLYLFEIAGPTTLNRKAGATYSDKTVDDVNDSNAAANANGLTAADHDIGDEVPFHITATISEKVGQFKKYHITLTDVLEAGCFDAITMGAKTLGGAAIADTADYTVTETWNTAPTAAGFKVTYEFTPKAGHDLSSLANKQIAIDFTATLGVNATIGADPNTNTLSVAYSNNPNEANGASEGATPDVQVNVFTYKVVIDKTDDAGAALAGAGFTLYKISKDDAEAGYAGLSAAATDASEKIAFWQPKAIQTYTSSAAQGATAGVNNRFAFTGLDDGYYVLCETTTPAGYNTMDPVVFKVDAVHNGGTDGKTLSSLTGTVVLGGASFTPDLTAGSLSATVINNRGVVLPETGGEGTQLLLFVGAAMLLGGGVLLVTKRRTEKYE